MSNEALVGANLHIQTGPDELLNADGTTTTPFKILAIEPAPDRDATDKEQCGGNFRITVEDFSAALRNTIPNNKEGIPAHTMLMQNMHAIIVAEELKAKLFSEYDEIWISPWDFAQRLWECCRTVPNEMSAMYPVNLDVVCSSLYTGAISTVLLSDMIPILFGQSSDKGGKNNE